MAFFKILRDEVDTPFIEDMKTKFNVDDEVVEGVIDGFLNKLKMSKEKPTKTVEKPPTKLTSKKSLRHPTGYTLFIREEMERTGKSHNEVASLWNKKLSEDERNEYIERARKISPEKFHKVDSDAEDED